MEPHIWLFGVPLVLGTLLVSCSALGAAELDTADEADGGSPHALLAWLGVGRVPAIIVLLLLCLIFGAVGLAVCEPLARLLGEGVALWIALPIAASAATCGTALVTRALAYVWPQTETYAPLQRDLLGACAVVVIKLQGDECIVRLLDAGGAELRLHCRVPASPVAVGEAVELSAREGHIYLARKVSQIAR